MWYNGFEQGMGNIGGADRPRRTAASKAPGKPAKNEQKAENHHEL